MNPIPVVVVTGALGAGKTTLINGFLGSEHVAQLRPALLINEFGRVGVDSLLLKERALETYEVNRGSVFCTCTQHAVVKTLARIAAGTRPGLLVIESTGMAEPCDLSEILALPQLAGAFEFRGTLCVVDAKRYMTTCAFLRAARQQVLGADVVVVNKADEASAAELDALDLLLRSFNPSADRIRTTHGQIDSALLTDITRTAPAGRPTECKPETVSAWSCESGVAFGRTAFYNAVTELGQRLLRFKGDVEFRGRGRRFVEVVCGDIVERDALSPDAEGSRFTAICFSLGSDEIEGAFMNAAVEPEPATA